MHGLTGGSWKRNKDRTRATEMKDTRGNLAVTSGSETYRRCALPRQLSTLLPRRNRHNDQSSQPPHKANNLTMPFVGLVRGDTVSHDNHIAESLFKRCPSHCRRTACRIRARIPARCRRAPSPTTKWQKAFGSWTPRSRLQTSTCAESAPTSDLHERVEERHVDAIRHPLAGVKDRDIAQRRRECEAPHVARRRRQDGLHGPEPAVAQQHHVEH